MNNKRIRHLKYKDFVRGNIAYWMGREQRINDNWALIYAQQKAIENKKSLFVFFNLINDAPNATIRQYGFMIKGLSRLEKDLQAKNIPFVLATGQAEQNIPELVKKYNIDLLVTDFNPLKSKKNTLKAIINKVDCSVCEVDAHNIIPSWDASLKQEYGAYTIRPKIRKKLYDFLDEFPVVEKHPYNCDKGISETAWVKVIEGLKINFSIPEITWLKPGEVFAKKILDKFITEKLNNYNQERNDPTKDALSNLSPYLHFGQISSQRAVMEVIASKANEEAKDAFIEEITVRKELADNFCYYNENYDNTESFPDWAKKTLNEHRKDTREYIYSSEELEQAKTHDELWNAAQLEMIQTGKMHGYMRMYWAKKILEWTESPEKAMEIAVYLNDKYEIDGNDPNGYTGIAWSIGGLHDRAWKERLVFGKIRYMSYNGAKSKFNVNNYVKKYYLE